MTLLHRSLAILLCSLAGSAASAEALLLQAAQIKTLGVETIVVGSSSDSRAGTLPAKVVVPNEQMRVLTAPVAGMIEMLAVAPGSSVRRGQVLAHLASPQALELQRDALQSGSQSSLQQQNLKRDEQLFAEGLIAESRLQATRAAASQAAAQASERQLGLSLAGIAPGKLGGALALTSPIDGVVLEQGVQVGQRVDSSAPVYRIAKISPLWLEIQAPQAIANSLRVGMPVKIAGSETTGKLIAVGRAIDAASQTVLLRASVSKGAEALIPGQVIEVEIAAGSSSGQRLPASALVREQGQTLVFVQTASSDKGTSFTPRPVKVIGQGGDSVVVEGVAANEKLAIKGLSGLKAMLTGVGQ